MPCNVRERKEVPSQLNTEKELSFVVEFWHLCAINAISSFPAAWHLKPPQVHLNVLALQPAQQQHVFVMASCEVGSS